MNLSENLPAASQREENVWAGIAVFFVALYVTDITFKWPDYGIDGVLYFCNTVVLLTAVAVLKRWTALASVLLSVASVLQMTWLADFYLYLVTGQFVTGDSAYLFRGGITATEYILGLRHLIIIPVLYSFCLRRGFERRLWVHAFGALGVYFLIVVLVRLLGTHPEHNVNCAFESCWRQYTKVVTPVQYIVGYAVSVTLLSVLMSRAYYWLFTARPRWARGLSFVILGLMAIGLVASLWHIPHGNLAKQ